jgi:hypothetical protein
MKLLIDRPQVTALADAFPELSPLREALRFGHRVEVASHQLSLPALDFLASLYDSTDASLAARAAQLRALATALRAGADDIRLQPGCDLEDLVPAMALYLTAPLLRSPGATDNAAPLPRGWLFSSHASGRPLAWVVTRMDYVPGTNDESAKLMLDLKAMARATVVQQTLRFTEADLRALAATHPQGVTVAEWLAAKGFLRETPQLLATYDFTTARYIDWRARYGAQFHGSGFGYQAEDPQATRRDTDWARKDQVILSASGQPARLVNDEGILPPRPTALDAPGDILGPYLRRASKTNELSHEDAMRALRQSLAARVADGADALFTQLPLQAYLFMFHLELHQHLWVHADDLQPYAYSPQIKHKLVLPREQTDLIDILTAEMDVMLDDVVAGKGGGTTVLCAGPPGVGKTLTAEVYAEVVGRPLYRVHSGQLGLSVAAMETALKEALTRAQRWGAVMLIDEADVYIRKRSDDIAANAVVGVFLRVLEYFNGLLFLTTNRIDDIDEAILSRCIAMIRYHEPDPAARQRIWQVMAEQFGLDLAPELIAWLTATYPQATGRDIKGLAKLVAKTCRHQGGEPTAELFARCAIFRALDPRVPGHP